MSNSSFADQLRAIADELKPLTIAVTPGDLAWNGTDYAKSAVRQPDPYALAWYSMLTAIAELIEGQESPITERQRAYLERLLFGGMGSLIDLSFDSKLLGGVATHINEGLNKKTTDLFASFKAAG
jgi:hypothetical protein